MTTRTMTTGSATPARSFFARRTLTVARELTGMHLVRVDGGRRLAGRIVETEAYQGPSDLAAHSARGQTERNAAMFGPPGFAYVYLIYGMWHCVNVVTREAGIPHAVLIRALEPLDAWVNDQPHTQDAKGRAANAREPKVWSPKTWGPGLLCQALNIDRALNGCDLLAPHGGDGLFIEAPVEAPIKAPRRIARAARIGVDYAGEWAQKPWRFFDRDSPYVSTVTAAQRRKALAARRT